MPDEVLPFRMTPVEVIEIGLGVRLHERANPDVQERKGMRVLDVTASRMLPRERRNRWNASVSSSPAQPE